MIVALTADDTESEPEAEGLGDPPALSGAAVRGLPPARTRLAAYLSWRKRVENELAALREGRAEIERHIANAEAAKGELGQSVDSGAVGILEQIKRGLNFSLGAAVTPRHLDVAARLMASAESLAIAKSALQKADVEIAAKTRLAETLAGRHGEFVSAALREHASETIGREYAATLIRLREQMGRLEALNLACNESKGPGDGSYVPPHQLKAGAEAPGYSVAGHHGPRVYITAYEVDILAARAAWDSLARGWQHDPKADAGRHLKFAPLAKSEYPSPTTANRKG